METQVIEKKERKYYIDWLRILLILSVFLFHVGMIFNPWSWHIKNDQLFESLKPIMSFLHLWRMPLLFLISGVGTFYALGKRSRGQYLKERFNRLFIPLVAGIFILVPVQVYMERFHLYDSLWDFYTHMFEGSYPKGNFSWHHLWFIVYLFFISLIVSPFLDHVSSPKLKGIKDKFTKIAILPLGLNIFLIPLLLSQLLLRPYFPEETHDFANDWAYMTYFILFFLAGFIMLSNKKITKAIEQQRFYYLIETILFTIAMFKLPGMAETRDSAFLIWNITSITVGWSCSVTAIGFAKKHLNFNSNFRRIANEAIYPFYLLHQPIIIVIGFYVTKLEIAAIWKALAITSLSFFLSVFIYWYCIRPFNAMRIIFGMKKMDKNEKIETYNKILKPVFVLVERTTRQRS